MKIDQFSRLSARCIALLAMLTAAACAASAGEREDALAQAERMAVQYDYDGAIRLLKSLPGHYSDDEAMAAVAKYAELRAACVQVKPSQVTHIFYHSLVVDPARAFSDPDRRPGAVGHNQWMTTIDEFNKITQEMYDRGYVFISIHDLVEKKTDANGNERFVTKKLLLPPGKKACILSLDDLSYYHSYNGFGYASKMIVDDDGRVQCVYYDKSGAKSVGAYDAVPLLDRFVEEHPDASYKGAKGIIALTGYNGILGYRTDATYDHKNIDDKSINTDKRRWLKAHPEFDRELERAEAKKVADAMRANGWEFASHSWGHIRSGQVTMAHLKTDTKKWLDNVAPLVGGSDVLIYAHGADIGDSKAYAMTNERFRFLKESGFDIFFNVNAHSYTLSVHDLYVRGGRRNLDGYRMYNNVYGKQRNLSDLFDAKLVLDPSRPPVRPLK